MSSINRKLLGTFKYLNTDLELRSTENLRPLDEALRANGFRSLHVETGPDGICYATFEISFIQADPEVTIARMLDEIEVLNEPHRTTWRTCAQREFNIGYDCGDEPWAYNQGLSNDLLRRIAASGASLRITLYPIRKEKRSKAKGTKPG